MRRSALTNHGVLLVGLLALFGLSPFLRGFMVVGQLANVLLTLIFLGVVFATLNRRRFRWIVAAIVVPTVILQWVDQLTSLPLALTLLRNLLQVITLSVGAVSILGDVVRSERVTPAKISGALSVYLLMGLIWALLYTSLEMLQPGSFHLGAHGEALQTHKQLFGDLFYYSFITLSTLGYGDITPVTDAARSFAVLEAIMGQFYLTVLVARLVGLQISQSGSPPSASS